MATGNPALDAYLLYMTGKGAKSTASRLANKFDKERRDTEYQRELRNKQAEELADQWNMYRTGNVKESRTKQLKNAAGIALSGATAFQRSMADNYLLAAAPKLAGRAVQGGVNLLGEAGIHSSLLNSIGSGAGTLAHVAAPAATAFRYAQYVNPLYAASSIASNKIFGAIGAATGNPMLASLLSGPALALAMPIITKVTKSVIDKVAGGGISKKYQAKLKPLAIDAQLHSAAEFVDENPLKQANQLLSQLGGSNYKVDPIQAAQMNFLAQITAQTSSIPILTSEFINSFIKKNASPASVYNSKLKHSEAYYQGKIYSEAIENHQHRMEHGKFAHTFTENVGLAATELSSWMNKMSILMDPIKQLQIVLSGGNINEEANKFGKSFTSVAQRNANIFAKTLGIGEKLSSAYFSLNEDSQAILARSKSFNDAQISLLSGIYEFTRITALETATLRVKAYGIKEPIKYDVIGKTDQQAKGVIEWLANKIPMFQLLRGTTGFALNAGRWMLEKALGYDNKLFKFIGHSQFNSYHDETYNRMARGYDYIHETSFTQRLVEPFINKLNKTILKIPGLRIFGNENRETLEGRSRKKYQKEMANAVEAAMKELGLNKLSDQDKYYKYATTSMPDQFDLMIHHLANVSLFTHATMINTANLASALTGQGHIEKPVARNVRTVNAYTGKLETEAEHKVFMQSVFKNVVGKVKENAFESKKTLPRLFTALGFAFNRNIGRTGNDEEKLQRGVIEALNYTFDKDRSTAAEVWALESNAGYYNPLISKDYLKELRNNPNALKNALHGKIDTDKVMQMRTAYGITSFSNPEQLANLESRMLKVDVARISAPAAEIKKIIDARKTSSDVVDAEVVGSAVVHTLASPKGAEIIEAATQAYNNHKNSSKYKISKDNSINDVIEAKKKDFMDIQVRQLENLTQISKDADKIAKHVSGETYTGMRAAKISAPAAGGFDLFSLFKGGKSLLGKVFKYGKMALPFLGDAASGLASGAAGAASFLATNPIGWAIDAVIATGAATYGLYEGRYGRQKALINKLSKAGIVDYNFFGKSKILRWDVVSKLSLDQVSQLLSFDDWDDKTKARLQQLVAEKTKTTLNADKQGKLILKTKKDFNKFLKHRDKELRKKEGFLGYWGGRTMNETKTIFGATLTGGGLLTGYNPKDIWFYNQLQNAGVISFSVLPFAESEVEDWNAVLKLTPVQIEKLLKLNWDKKTKARLREILNTRLKQKYHTTGDVDKYIKSIKEHKIKLGHQKEYNLGHRNIMQRIADATFNPFGNDVVDLLMRKGAIVHHFLGNSEITKKGWELISKLSPKQIAQVIDFNDWDQETKTRLVSIMQSKLKQGKTAAQPSAQQKPRTHTDIDEVTTTPTQKQNTDTDLLATIVDRITALLDVTAKGHSEQIKVAAQTAKQLAEKQVDEIKHPIMDTGKGL